MGKVWVQNNIFAGAITKVEGKLMEFATEDEAMEYQKSKTFAEVLQKEVQKLEAKHGGSKIIYS